jgi:hypothetical protein
MRWHRAWFSLYGRVTQTPRAYDFYMGGPETESKEANRMAVTRKRLRPNPSWTPKRRPSLCLFVVAFWELTRQGEIPAHPLGKG